MNASDLPRRQAEGLGEFDEIVGDSGPRCAGILLINLTACQIPLHAAYLHDCRNFFFSSAKTLDTLFILASLSRVLHIVYSSKRISFLENMRAIFIRPSLCYKTFRNIRNKGV